MSGELKEISIVIRDRLACLYLDEDVGVGVGEGDVAEGLQAAPDLLHRRDPAADSDAGEAALEPTVGDGLRDPEREADGGVGEGHGGGDDGEPPYLIKVRYLREDDLDGAEEDHVRVAGAPARVLVVVVVASDVEAVRPLDRPHADCGGDGVSDGDADEVGVLDDAAEPDLGAAEDVAHGLRVRVVALPGVAAAVALGEQRGGVVADAGEEQHHGGARRPAQLRHRPRQGQDAGADHRRDDVRARRPHRARPPRPPIVVV